MTELTPQQINDIGCRGCIIINKYKYALNRFRYGADVARIPELKMMRERLCQFEDRFIATVLTAYSEKGLEKVQAEFDQIIAEAEALNQSLVKPIDPNEVFGEMEGSHNWPRLQRFAHIDDSIRYEEF